MNKIILIPDRRTESGEMKEKNSYFHCPNNTVITGRWHKGDENGKTRYEYSTLKAVDENGNTVSGVIKFANIRWEVWFKESSGNGFDAGGNRVIIGREHKGDEKGNTRYETAEILFNDESTTIEDGYSANPIKESSGIWFRTDADKVITGRRHYGDENGRTIYTSGKLTCFTKPTEKAPAGTTIVPDKRSYSSEYKESSHSFICPQNTVLTGRKHTGDENGTTVYEYATLKAVKDGKVIDDCYITVENIRWIGGISESEGFGFDAPFGKVIVGRQHFGDENSATAYAVGDVMFNGHPTKIINYDISMTLRESGGIQYSTDSMSVITARHHYGDENGNTYYGYGTISCDGVQQPKEKITIRLKLASNENYFPMDPKWYIKLSRMRRHNDGRPDDGFSRTKREFIVGSNSHNSEFYNIKIEDVAKQFPSKPHQLFNLRPYEDKSLKKNEVFLEPDNNLHGDSDPNFRVPVFKYVKSWHKDTVHRLEESINYWIFFGFNSATQGNHQGDWECITVFLDKSGKITSASLSAHDDSNEYTAEQLEFNDSVCTDLNVYCEKGSHAMYNKPSSLSVLGIDNKGYTWTITDNVIDLRDSSENSDVEWKTFAGAWGNISDLAWKTGPMGPWQKCGGLMNQVINEMKNPKASKLIKENQLLLVFDRTIKEDVKVVGSESDGTEVKAEDGYILFAREHSGNENEKTTYLFRKLKAINHNGETVEGGNITLDDKQWTAYHKQSDSEYFYNTTSGGATSRVIIGRQHKGDENGETRYLTAELKYKGKPVTILPYPDAELAIKEDWKGYRIVPKQNLIIVGIRHKGDERDDTFFDQGYIVVEP